MLRCKCTDVNCELVNKFNKIFIAGDFIETIFECW